MEYRFVQTTEEFDQLKEDWERLENTTPQITFFSTYRYARTKWEVYRDYNKYQLWMIVVEHNNCIVGIAPLMLVEEENRFIKWKSLQLLAVGDYGDFLVDSNGEVKLKNIYKEMFKAIEDNSELWDEISIHHIQHKSALTLYLFGSAYRKHLSYLIENPYIDLSEISYEGEIIKESMPNKVIQYSNRLFKKTAYELHCSRENILDKFAPIHISEKQYLQSKGLSERHSLFEDSLRFESYNKLFDDNPAAISYYLLDTIQNSILIYNCGFLHEDVFYSINTAYDPEYASFGAGKVIYYEMFKDAIYSKLWKRLDAGTGGYQWKFEWATGFNLLYSFHKINPNSRKLRHWRKIQGIKRSIVQ